MGSGVRIRVTGEDTDVISKNDQEGARKGLACRKHGIMHKYYAYFMHFTRRTPISPFFGRRSYEAYVTGFIYSNLGVLFRLLRSPQSTPSYFRRKLSIMENSFTFSETARQLNPFDSSKV